ncbi:MAG: tRNA pseudouridine(54/55) synthase Pus10 [Candidatus Heimdallarchaeota archaeon]|nr:tRNA pseudouridine(54/55) synthase Pus10 [Candidatus Heimdallarchaeota archaeon]
MNLLEKATKILHNHSLCDYCLGRQFSNLATGTTNRRRGITIKEFLTMNTATPVENENFSFLQILSKSGGTLAKNTLKKKENIPEETKSCYICRDTLEFTDNMVDIVVPNLKDIEFQTLLIGTILPKEFFEREKKLKEEFDVLQTEFLKQEFNRIIGKKISERLPVTTDFKSPEIVIEVAPISSKFEMRIKSLYISGRYLKYLRTIPQTRWPCNKCKGRGCDVCNGTGKRYQESVEELIEFETIRTTNSTKGVLHGAGREDIDALMLGNGRPFVFEVVSPRIRTIDLDKLQDDINRYTKGKIEVKNFRWSSIDELRDLKGSAETTVKKYRAKVLFDETIDNETVSEIENYFVNKEIDQRTPQRVVHRRADKIRKKTVFSVECSRLSENEIETIITCDGGCYVKELISGDEDRTIPNISKVAGIKAICKELDVLEVRKDIEEK